MKSLPLILSREDAINYYNNTSGMTDAEKAYVVRILSEEGLSNKCIRQALGIHKVYTVTHYKRVGTALSDDEIELWMNNPCQIKLGHVRAIAKFPRLTREPLLRELLAKKISVHQYEMIAQGKREESHTDVKIYAQGMEDQLGRPVSIQYNAKKSSGSITLGFYGLNDLDDVSESLGYVLDAD